MQNHGGKLPYQELYLPTMLCVLVMDVHEGCAAVNCCMQSHPKEFHVLITSAVQNYAGILHTNSTGNLEINSIALCLQ